MNIPEKLMYTKSHEWIEFLPGNTARVGITDHAQDMLGDIVYVNLPEVGDEVEREDAVVNVESVKIAADVYTPVAGTITAVNEDLLDAPEALNEDAYGAWIFALSDVVQNDSLLTAAEYLEFVKAEEH